MADLAARLEPYILLARSTKGAAAAKIVLDATAAPGVYVFSELLEQPNIRDLAADPSYSAHHRLLRLFAYGSLADYEADPSTFPPLTPTHRVKLQHLTLVSLALKHRSLRYDRIAEALKLESTRQLEDTVINVIYAGLLGGKMHHHEKILHIDWVAGRDVQEADLAGVRQGLQNWCETAQSLISALDRQIDHVRLESEEEARRQTSHRETRDQEYHAIAQELRKNNKSGGWGGPSGSGSKGGLMGGFSQFTNPPMNNEALLAAVAGGRGASGPIRLTRNVSSSDEIDVSRLPKRAKD
ncbi:hypothetical protein IAU60_004817 [Kwoniella sp. DSM 27419]